MRDERRSKGGGEDEKREEGRGRNILRGECTVEMIRI